jgi:Protein of unknown function (DUF2490)
VRAGADSCGPVRTGAHRCGVRTVRHVRACLAGLAWVLLLPVQAAAQDTVDSQLWLQAVATLRLSENWRLHLEEQPRWYEDWSEPYQIITRTALGRRLNPRVTLWGGYAWIAKPPGEGVTHEQRIWEQLSATFPTAANWTPSLRLRVEQRFQDGWSESSHRLRMMGRGVRPIDARARWSLVGWDEVMLTLDDTDAGPAQGVDQNRLFVGTLRQFSPQVGLEFGYLWVTSEPPGGARTHAHNLFVWLNLTP